MTNTSTAPTLTAGEIADLRKPGGRLYKIDQQLAEGYSLGVDCTELTSEQCRAACFSAMYKDIDWLFDQHNRLLDTLECERSDLVAYAEFRNEMQRELAEENQRLREVLEHERSVVRAAVEAMRVCPSMTGMVAGTNPLPLPPSIEAGHSDQWLRTYRAIRNLVALSER